MDKQLERIAEQNRRVKESVVKAAPRTADALRRLGKALKAFQYAARNVRAR